MRKWLPSALAGLGYALFLLLWFRDSFPVLKGLRVTPAVPLIGTAALLAWRMLQRFKRRTAPRSPRPKGSALLILIVVLLALAVRIPYLGHAFGLMSSDDAVPALMAKHISEGRHPPVYYYGQLYMGSVSQHLQAVFFKLFGYSILRFKLSILIFFLGFMVVQFRLIEACLSRSTALACSLFYLLPIGFTVSLSLDTTGAFPLVMLLGSGIMAVTHAVAWRSRHDLTAWLGFLMGLAFWTHQIAVGFILTAGILLISRARLRFGRWVTLTAGFLLGGLPVLLMEIRWGFPLVRFLLPDSGQSASAGAGARTLRLLLSLLCLRDHPLRLLLLGAVLAGAVWLAVRSARARRLQPSIIFPLFFVLFLLLYLFSGFSGREAVRYLYPLYFCLPVLLLAPFHAVPARLRFGVMAGGLLLIWATGSLPEITGHFARVKRSHAELRGTVADLLETGERNWQAEYWTAYLLTALSGERARVASNTFDRYFPYRLDYHNSGPHDNFVLAPAELHPGGRAAGFPELLKTLGVPHHRRRSGSYVLIHGISGPVFPKTLRARGVEAIPRVSLEEMSVEGGFMILHARFQGGSGLDRFGWHVEIPEYSAAFRKLPAEGGEVRIRLPIPEGRDVRLEAWLDYEGLPVPATRRIFEAPISGGHSPRRRPIPLSGFGPRIEWEDRNPRVMEKRVRFRIDRLPTGGKIRLDVISPFDFSDPYWYGDFAQSVRIRLGGNTLTEHRLAFGFNRIDIPVGAGADGSSRMLELEFAYHLPFPFAPLWKTAALLDTISILDAGQGEDRRPTGS